MKEGKKKFVNSRLSPDLITASDIAKQWSNSLENFKSQTLSELENAKFPSKVRIRERRKQALRMRKSFFVSYQIKKSRNKVISTRPVFLGA